jgi:catechol 2,3-dioxygenase
MVPSIVALAGLGAMFVAGRPFRARRRQAEHRLGSRVAWAAVTASIDPATSVGRVTLTVRDIAGVGDFYERVVGLREIDAVEGSVVLGAGDTPLVELVEDLAAPPRPPRTTGLFHLAILVPDRAELARSLQRLVETGWPLAGASDHLVSEALYLSDPEGNGIEIYRDRPADEWQRDGDELRMATLPLDLHDLLGAVDGDPAAGAAVPTDTRMGHVHLNVADLEASERFYAGLLGLDVTARGYPGALFLAAGGYHHHIGLNTWRGQGIPAPPPGSLGLRSFDLTLPSQEALDGSLASLRTGGGAVDGADAAALARDPAGNAVRLTIA